MSIKPPWHLRGTSMVSQSTVSVVILALWTVAVRAQTYSATYLPSNAPAITEEGQEGTNQCGTSSNQTSLCQNVYVNSVTDWCVFGPPESGPASTIGNIERIAISWCIKDGYGTRLIPEGTITGAHIVKTPDFVQVTGVGDLTKLNIPEGDAGGELDPHGADGNGNPIGGLVFSSAFGELQQMHEWTNFVSSEMFCIRACAPGPMAPTWCQHIYDVLGCQWNMPANYSAGTFEDCEGDSGQPMGVYGTSTFFQGQAATPAAHPAPSSSLCTAVNTIGVASSTSSASVTQTGSSSETAGRASSTGTSAGVSGTSTANSAVHGKMIYEGWASLILSLFPVLLSGLHVYNL
ncbi:uncharacterized protein EV420DRAFT_1544456 [Desarmillaria tabescens]|uniref:Carbohydrate-binding module family 13 protein n=1 Tax=Armillaria tabescens TaxID=1929756 RepID=A0AA39KBV7_ARMTA|nr:uncharacterized protein EV420DRAFT_1544456 [Desarmillaria tabescens]KAK0458245.1 hypothetical protein EV420DRAFT_1544456 [Desarmillaria tabescens]